MGRSKKYPNMVIPKFAKSLVWTHKGSIKVTSSQFQNNIYRQTNRQVIWTDGWTNGKKGMARYRAWLRAAKKSVFSEVSGKKIVSQDGWRGAIRVSR